MNLGLQSRWAERWEGRRRVAYDDATGKPIHPDVPLIGNPTIGVGLNLRTASAHIAVAGMGLNYSDVLAARLALTDQQIDNLLGGALMTALSDARRLFAEFDAYPENQQIVIVDLSFNMGGPKLATFTHTCAAIRAQDWTHAAADLQNSAWFHQVGARPDQRGGANVAVLSGAAQPEDVLKSN